MFKAIVKIINTLSKTKLKNNKVMLIKSYS